MDKKGAIAVEAVTPWLLRIGIDHTGRFEPTQLWDIGIRGAVLADLWLAQRVADAGPSLEVDTTPTGAWYLDEATCELASGRMTQLGWIGRGRLRASDVADELVSNGEWSRRRSLTVAQWKRYRSHPIRQYMPLRTRLAHVYDGRIRTSTPIEATIAVLGHALNVVRPDRFGHPRLRGLSPAACGSAQAVVEATVEEIFGFAGSVHANSNPAW
jgi:hypothetical protein